MITAEVRESTTTETRYPPPQYYYVAGEFFERDLERVFATSWLFVCASSQLPRPGDMVTWSVGRDSVLLTRG